jgi:hypothetical protein
MTSLNSLRSDLPSRAPRLDLGCPILRAWERLTRWALGGLAIGTFGIALSAGCGLDGNGSCLSCDGVSTELASPSSPAVDTAVGRLLKQWLALYNSGDAKKIADFVSRHYTPSARAGRTPQEIAQRELSSREEVEGYSITRIEEATSLRLTARLQQWNAQGFARLVIQVDPRTPEIITELSRSPIEMQ